MRYWVLKALVQGAISVLPRNQYWNYLLQNYVSKSLCFSNSKFDLKLRECKKHLENFFSLSHVHNKTSFSVLELGTGWYPIIPIGLYLCGATRVWTIDRTHLLSRTRVKEVLRLFVKYAEIGNLVKILPWIRTDRIVKLRNALEETGFSSGPDILEKLNIYAIVCDARETGLEGSSIDFIESNTTLEYIPKDIVKGIFIEYRRLASPTALMSHFIVTGDHYADFDKSITPFNFLRYPNWQWRLFNNSLHYQNRLRISDYRRIHQTAGFKILHEYNDKGSPEHLDNIPIAREFRHYSKDDLLIIRSFIVSTCYNNFPKL